MTIAINWHNPERTVIYIECPEEWEWHHLEQADQSLLDMLNVVSHRVSLIINLSGNIRLPPGRITHYVRKSLQNHNHPNLAGVVCILKNSTLTDITLNMVDLYGVPHIPYVYANDLEDATHLGQQLLNNGAT